LDARFAFYVICSSVFRDYGAASMYGAGGQKRVPTDFIADFPLPLPPRSEQRAIADFLDLETGKIDTLIERASAFAAALDESRCGAVAQAITRGMRGDVRLRQSGVAWWPEIPTHWKIKPLKYLVKPSRYITYGIVQAGPNIPDGVPYIRTSDLSGSELPLSGYLRTSHEIDSSYARSRVATGDLVIAIRATVGKTLMVPPELDGANLTQGTARISPNSETSSEYLLHVLNSPPARSGFMSMAKGATFKEITLDMLRNFPVPVPPMAEQAAIVAALDTDAVRYRRAFALVEEQRQRLLEHRSALITAAVTGEIEVAANIAAEAAA
jgi:type I restriction enzyme S subunit